MKCVCTERISVAVRVTTRFCCTSTALCPALTHLASIPTCFPRLLKERERENLLVLALFHFPLCPRASVVIVYLEIQKVRVLK